MVHNYEITKVRWSLIRPPVLFFEHTLLTKEERCEIKKVKVRIANAEVGRALSWHPEQIAQPKPPRQAAQAHPGAVLNLLFEPVGQLPSLRAVIWSIEEYNKKVSCMNLSLSPLSFHANLRSRQLLFIFLSFLLSFYFTDKNLWTRLGVTWFQVISFFSAMTCIQWTKAFIPVERLKSNSSLSMLILLVSKHQFLLCICFPHVTWVISYTY